MDAREEELLQGMGNCYAACGAGFDETLRMVAEHRGLTPEQVRDTLLRIRKQYGDDARYLKLRARFPADFPC